MVSRKAFLLFISLLILSGLFAFADPMISPSWGFALDLPQDYEYTDGDNKDRYSFENPLGAKFDISVYYAPPGRSAPYASVEELVKDIQTKLNNSGESDFFEYRQKKACLFELSFLLPQNGTMSGWALCLELSAFNSEPSPSGPGTAGPRAAGPGTPAAKPLLLAMAYGPEGKSDLEFLHFSALDSLAPEERDRHFPGPITEYGYPRETRIQTEIFGLNAKAWIFKEDAEAAQALVDREFQLLRLYQNSPNWKEAWSRFYRMIYRDSYERLSDIAFQVERNFNVPARENRDLADEVLHWVQSFEYERDLFGSDFINLITAAVEGRGDCDNRAMLWSIILIQANIPAAIMVSREYSHAMGLADLGGSGARFEVDGKRLLVAETTAKVSIGLIGETVSDIEYWLGIMLE